jgi:hypothetical protein
LLCLPPPALIMPSPCQHDGIAPAFVSLMSCCQSSQDADVDVGVKCVFLVTVAGGGKRGG